MAHTMVLQVQGAGLEPTTTERVEAQGVQVEGRIGGISIEEIRGPVSLRSGLKNGKLSIEFSPHFAWGVGTRALRAADKENYIARLRELGLTDDQITGVGHLLDTEQAVDVEPLVAQTELPGWLARSEAAQVPAPVTTGERAALELPLPDIPINLDTQVDLRDVELAGVGFRETTTVVTEDMDLSGLGIDDFEVHTPAPEPITLDQAEVLNLRTRPAHVPSLALSNLKTTLAVPRISSDEIALDLEVQRGGADLNATLLDWHPRWRASICVRVLWVTVCLWIEYGINFKISLHYRWVLERLHQALRIRNAIAKEIKVGLSIARMWLSNLRMGGLRLGRLLYAKA